MTTRAAHRAQVRNPSPDEVPVAGRRRTAKPNVTPRPSKLRIAAFLAIAAIVVGGGVYVASNVFMGQRDKTNVSGAITMGISMDGFNPNVLHAKAGQTLTLDWWNEDAPMHLTGGVHSLVSDTLKVHLELPAQSRKTVQLTAPMAPGDYDFWCDSCCGGKDNPKMHATLHVEA